MSQHATDHLTERVEKLFGPYSELGFANHDLEKCIQNLVLPASRFRVIQPKGVKKLRQYSRLDVRSGSILKPMNNGVAPLPVIKLLELRKPDKPHGLIR